MASGNPSSKRTTSATAWRVAFVELEPRPLRAGADREQLDRLAVQSQRLDGEYPFSFKVQSFTAGDDERRLAGPVKPSPDGSGCVLLHLLEVVQDHEAAPAPGDGMAQLHRRIVLAQWHR